MLGRASSGEGARRREAGRELFRSKRGVGYWGPGDEAGRWSLGTKLVAGHSISHESRDSDASWK